MSQGVECYSCLPKTAWPPDLDLCDDASHVSLSAQIPAGPSVSNPFAPLPWAPRPLHPIGPPLPALAHRLVAVPPPSRFTRWQRSLRRVQPPAIRPPWVLPSSLPPPTAPPDPPVVPDTIGPTLDLSMSEVIVFTALGRGFDNSLGIRIVDAVLAAIPGFVALDTHQLNNDLGHTLREAVTLEPVKRRRWVYTLFSSTFSEADLDDRKEMISRVSTAEFVVGVAGYKSCKQAYIFTSLIHELTRVTDPIVRDLLAREVVFYDGVKGISVRQGLTVAVRQAALKCSSYQYCNDFCPRATMDTLTHYVNTLLFRDVVRLHDLPSGSGLVFQRRGRSNLRWRPGPRSV